MEYPLDSLFHLKYGGGAEYARWNLAWSLESHEVMVHLVLGRDSLSR
ncbi:hypothetical protein [Helicobacter ganmani]